MSTPEQYRKQLNKLPDPSKKTLALGAEYACIFQYLAESYTDCPPGGEHVEMTDILDEFEEVIHGIRKIAELPPSDLVKALQVMVLDKKHRMYLHINDPKAMEQVEQALQAVGAQHKPEIQNCAMPGMDLRIPIIAALQHAAKSFHHPECDRKYNDGQHCSCHVAKAQHALVLMGLRSGPVLEMRES